MSYEHALRLIGYWLDQRNPDYIQLAETAEGFRVQWQRGHDRRTAISQRFSEENFIRLEMQAREMRGRSARTGLPTQQEETYEDLLRALGHEFDESSARAVELHELDAGFFVAYQRPNGGAPAAWRKHTEVVSLPRQLKLLRAAYTRRRTQGGLSARLRHSS